MQSCFFAIRPIVVVVVLLYCALLQHRNVYILLKKEEEEEEEEEEKEEEEERNTDLYNYMIPYATTDKTDRYMEYLRFSITLEFA